MSIDFEVPAEAKAIREKVRKWVQEECIPAEKELDTKPLDEVLGKLRAKARAQGLWCPFVPKQYGAAWGSARSPTRWCRWSSAKACSARRGRMMPR
jgi:alkylation response protein AidB-like acyl-CoA dehydrogenase